MDTLFFYSFFTNTCADYLVEWIQNVTTGWKINFSNDMKSGLMDQVVRVDPSKLIVGFSFGNNGSGKTVFIWPKDVGDAWERLGGGVDGAAPRGVMFWNAHLDQLNIFNGTKRDNYTLASGFNKFLKVR